MLSINSWDINLIDFIIKFYSDRDKMKIRFNGFEDEVNDFVIKTLVIERLTYIPDCLRDKIVESIDVEDNSIVIKIKGTFSDITINEMKRKNYIFEKDVMR